MIQLQEQFSSTLNLKRNQIEQIYPNFRLLSDIVNVSNYRTLERYNPQITEIL